MLLSSTFKKSAHSSKIFISYIAYELASVFNYYSLFILNLAGLLVILSVFC